MADGPVDEMLQRVLERVKVEMGPELKQLRNPKDLECDSCGLHIEAPDTPGWLLAWNEDSQGRMDDLVLLHKGVECDDKKRNRTLSSEQILRCSSMAKLSVRLLTDYSPRRRTTRKLLQILSAVEDHRERKRYV